MRHAYTLLGVMTLVVSVGAYIAFSTHEGSVGPVEETEVTASSTMSFTLTSSAFDNDGAIPSSYTCDSDAGETGVHPHPELKIGGVPPGTQSLVLIMEDFDIPQSVKDAHGIEKFDHWVVYNIPADTAVVPERSVVGTEGLSSRGTHGYVPPCPPDGEHRYLFTLYALPEVLEFDHVPTAEEVVSRARARMLDSVLLIGRYTRSIVV